MIVQRITKRAVYGFKDLPVVMLEDRTVYHTIKRKEIQKKINCRSVGYWIDRRFFTLSKLNKISEKLNKEIEVELLIDCPF